MTPRHSLLIVDDIEVNRSLLERRLRNNGFRLSFAENGHEALDKIRGGRFDLVLPDIMMPGLDGFGVLAALVDVYDALTSRRCYKEAFSHENAGEILVAESGRHFDPRIVAVFCQIEQAFRASEPTIAKRQNEKYPIKCP